MVMSRGPILRMRFSRASGGEGPSQSSAPVCGRSSGAVRFHFEGLRLGRLPRTCEFSRLRVWCHALPAASRVLRESAACAMGCGAGRGSDITHLAVAPLFRVVAMQLLGDVGFWPCASGLRRMSLLSSPPEALVACLALDAGVHTFRHCRHQPARDVDEVRDVLRPRLVQLFRWAPSGVRRLC